MYQRVDHSCSRWPSRWPWRDPPIGPPTGPRAGPPAGPYTGLPLALLLARLLAFFIEYGVGPLADFYEGASFQRAYAMATKEPMLVARTGARAISMGLLWEGLREGQWGGRGGEPAAVGMIFALVIT